PCEREIIIDGIDIRTIGINGKIIMLHYYSHNATLFSGILRDNLDPFGRDHDHAVCMDALNRVHMISDSPTESRGPSHGQSTAASPSSSRGTNFSQGQRQLIAMARALLRRSSLVVMDEATSSVDFATDAKIQKAIREEFADSLPSLNFTHLYSITVAHRLNTIIDYDRLVVLDHGRVVEFDTPYTLIRKENGVLRNMCLNKWLLRRAGGCCSRKKKKPTYRLGYLTDCLSLLDKITRI
ncbi:P-loop containing nucleoside triphosphate hydrolase protein, partial [Mycena leptocephala]